MVYEFSMEWMENGFDPNDPKMSGCRTEEESKAGWVEQKSLWSKVRKIDSDVHVTLDDLGASGADILQCNGVVWVEGPSDVIYLREWLRMHARKEGRKQLVQGQHYGKHLGRSTWGHPQTGSYLAQFDAVYHGENKTWGGDSRKVKRADHICGCPHLHLLLQKFSFLIISQRYSGACVSIDAAVPVSMRSSIQRC